MTEESTPAVAVEEVPAVAPKTPRKKTAKKPAATTKATKKTSKKTVKKAAKGVKKTRRIVKKTVKKERTPRGESVRVRALKAIAKGGEMTAAEVQAKIGLGHGLKPTLDQEVERGHLGYAPHKDEHGTATYRIMAAGRKALENGTVNPKRGE